MLLNVRLRDGEFELTSTTASPDLSAAATGDERRVGLLVLCLLALGVGIMTGIGAVILRSLIGLIHNLMFNGVFRIAYDANIRAGGGIGCSCRRSSAASSSSIWSTASRPKPRATGCRK